MKKLILTAVFTAICFMTSAQVGIGTTNPETTLHVVGANATGTTNTPGALNAVDGIAVPVVTDDMTTTTTNGTKVSQLVYSNNAASTGFYFWSGTAWVAMSGGASRPDFTVGAILDNLDVTTTSDFSTNTANNVFNITQSGAGPGATNITLPTPANNTGRIIVIKNRGAKGVAVLNCSTGCNVASSAASIFYCDGTEWVRQGV